MTNAICSAIVLTAALAACGRMVAQNPEAPLWMRTSGQAEAAQAEQSQPIGGEVLRAIDDPHTGARWLLLRNAEHPEGPGVLVMVQAGKTGNSMQSTPRMVVPAQIANRTQPPLIVVRSGDSIVVHEATPVVEAILEAVAIGNASAGQELLARLKIGGRMVRVRATAPRRAEFVADAERMP